MSGFDDEMQRALEADGEKLRQLTGEDHGPRFLENEIAEELRKFHRNSCYPEAMDFEVETAVQAILVVLRV